MERLTKYLSVLDAALHTKKKRHLAGGILISVSLLFASLSYTILTIKEKDDANEQRS